MQGGKKSSGGFDIAESFHEPGGRQRRADGDELGVARELLALHRHLSAIAAQGAEPAVVTDVLAEYLEAPVWLVSETHAVLGVSGPGTSPSELTEELHRWLRHPGRERILQVVSETRSAVRSPESGDRGPLIVAPVLIDFKVAAYLLTVEPEGNRESDFTFLALEHGATVCGVMLSRERVLGVAAGRARDDLVEGLLLGHTLDRDELGRWARYLGVDASVPHRVMLFTCGAEQEGAGVLAPGRGERVNEVIKHFCDSRGTDVLTISRDGEAIAIAPEAPSCGPTPTGLAADCHAYCHELFADVALTVVLSKVCTDLESIAAAYREVRRTMTALGRLGRHGGVVALEDLGLHRLLLQIPDLEELRSFAVEVLGPLANYDRARGTQLLETLGAFFNEGGSVRRMAEHLHVHPNTVTYRLRRCAELGKFDLDRHRDRLTVQVALEILDLVGPLDG